MNTLAALTENDKRLIIVLIIGFVLIFVIFGYLGVLIKKIMSFQGKKADDMVHDVVVTGVINKPRKLLLFGLKKNYQLLVKQAWMPFLIMFLAALALLIYCLTTSNWDVNLIDYQKEGFTTLFFIPDFANCPTTQIFGITVISNWPPLLNSPHFEVEAWGSYVFFAGMLVGGIWFLICTQAYMARTFRLIKLSKTVFNKSLENFNANEMPPSEINPENPEQ